VLEATLQKWSYELTVTCAGDEAWGAPNAQDAPHLVILDWMMPGLDGPEICRRLREREDGGLFYVVLLTAKNQPEDIVAGLDAGADDYVTKPFNREELRARVQTGLRIIRLQEKLADRVTELEQALRQVKTLHGLLPICAYCKRIREGEMDWQQVENYIASHSDANFSHGVCPDCYDRVVKPQLETLG
jgi:sigma-B regulation protein RsbU (phosphoserine phosphatase)